MSEGDVVRAAGCVVWRTSAGGIEMAVVHRPRYDDWSFPKGKVDPGETELECATREVEEETGLVGVVGEELPTVRYVDHQQRPKTVRYWLLEQAGGTFAPNDEVDELCWLDPAGSRAILTYEHDRTLLDAALAVLGT